MARSLLTPDVLPTAPTGSPAAVLQQGSPLPHSCQWCWRSIQAAQSPALFFSRWWMREGRCLWKAIQSTWILQ